MTTLTAKDLDVLSHILTGEEMACKKARMYSNTLTDTALSEQLREISSAHAERFNTLFKLLGGKQ